VVPAEVLFVGEAPGKTEDVMGKPFVGRAGKLLDYWIEYAKTKIDFTYCISNLVACRPTDRMGGENRVPTAEEINNCAPRLQELYDMCKPRVLVFLGQTAKAECRLPHKILVHEIGLIHPAACLRQGGQAAETSNDARSRLAKELWSALA